MLDVQESILFPMPLRGARGVVRPLPVIFLPGHPALPAVQQMQEHNIEIIRVQSHDVQVQVPILLRVRCPME